MATIFAIIVYGIIAYTVATNFGNIVNLVKSFINYHFN